MLDTKALAEATATIVREHVSAAVDPLMARIAALEAKNASIGSVVFEIVEATDFVARVAEISAGIALKSIPAPKDGKDADPAVIASAVDNAVAKAVASLPPAEKGEKGDAGEPGNDGQPGERGLDGKDGVGLAGMMIDRSGEAVATLTDGTMIKLGPVVGRDGSDGAAGEPGRDGRDGQDLSDIQVVQEGAKLELTFVIGETRSIYEVQLPEGPAGADGLDAYAGEARGLHDAAETYRKMDVVSFNGSEWRAKQDDPGEIPGPGWMLSACKGKRGDRGERGISGKDGLSPVAQYLRGAELVTTLSDGAEIKADLSDLSALVEQAEAK